MKKSNELKVRKITPAGILKIDDLHFWLVVGEPLPSQTVWEKNSDVFRFAVVPFWNPDFDETLVDDEGETIKLYSYTRNIITNSPFIISYLDNPKPIYCKLSTEEQRMQIRIPEFFDDTMIIDPDGNEVPLLTEKEIQRVNGEDDD